jgi:hypothetical protein
MRTIQYIPKTTQAKTQYREISQEDMSWLQSELIKYLSTIGELSIAREEDLKEVYKEFTRRHTSLPKGKTGYNTVQSFISGMINNLVFGEQRDLSDKQMDALEIISNVMALTFKYEQFRFQIGLGL